MFKITLKVAFQNPIGQKARTVIDLVANVRSRLTIICTFITIISLGQNRKVCFSYDDLPVVSYGRADSSFQKNLMKNLIGSLNRNRIPAIGFVNETKLYNRSGLIHFQVELLDSWSDGGLDLGWKGRNPKPRRRPDETSPNGFFIQRDSAGSEKTSRRFARCEAPVVRRFHRAGPRDDRRFS